jgi:hypothetical protein
MGGGMGLYLWISIRDRCCDADIIKSDRITMENELWYLMIDGEKDAETGVFGNFYAYGSHLGDALDKAVNASVEYGFAKYNLTEASLLNSFEEIGDNEELVEIADDVYMRPTMFSFSLSDPDKSFIPPTGIVKSVFDGEYDYDLIKEKFVAYNADENGIFKFELVLEKKNLLETFINSIDVLTIVDGFCIYIKDYWGNELIELWIAKNFVEKDTIAGFLKKQEKNTIQNGYLDIVIYSLKGQTNLILDDHKKIQLQTQDEEVFKSFVGSIIALGYEQTKDFYNLEFGYHHFHYRLANSLPRTEFKQMLEDNKFELINSWEE